MVGVVLMWWPVLVGLFIECRCLNIACSNIGIQILAAADLWTGVANKYVGLYAPYFLLYINKYYYSDCLVLLKVLESKHSETYKIEGLALICL